MASPEKQFAIFRIEKLHTHAEISRVGNHNDRTGIWPDNVDPKRVKLNRSYTPTTTPLLERVQARLAGMKFRKDAVRAVEIFCGFSPGCEKFVPIEDWAQASLSYVKKKFGAKNLVSAVLHMDEQTPHMHFVIVPIIEGKLAAKRIFGKRAQLHQMQNEYFDVVKKFGFARGTKGSSRPHLPMREIYEGTHEGLEIVQKAMDSIPKKSPVASWEKYRGKLQGHLTKTLEPLTTAKTEATLAALEIESLRKLVNDSELATQAEKSRLRQLDLREVACRLLGYEGVKDGKSTVFEDDARKIVITGNAFKDEKSDARGERGAISLTRHILEVDFDTAIRVLAQHFPKELGAVQAEATRVVEDEIKARVEAASQFPADDQSRIDYFAKRDPTKLKGLTEHLHKIKNIPTNIIKNLVNKTILWANRWGSACFLKQDTKASERMGVSIVGTTTDSLQSIGPKDTFFALGDLNKTSVVAITPDPVKAMQFHAKTGLSVIAVDSIDHSGEVFDFLRAFGVRKVTLAEESTWYGKKMKDQWKADAVRAEFMFIEEAKISPQKNKDGTSDPKLSGP